MRRRTRNLLAALLLDALDDPADAQIPLLRVLCESVRSGSVTEFLVPEIIRVAQQKTHRSAAILLQAAHRLAAFGGPLRARHAAAGKGLPAPLRLDEDMAERDLQAGCPVTGKRSVDGGNERGTGGERSGQPDEEAQDQRRDDICQQCVRLFVPAAHPEPPGQIRLV